MKYQGSKSRIASDIIPIMLEAFSKNNCEIFIDCCVGGGNLLDKIPHSIERYGNDSNEYLIEMWKAVSNGWIPPKIITENDYYNIRDNKDDNKALTGYVGFALSYGGKWFGGWSRGKDNKGNDRDYVDESYRNCVLKQFPLLKGVKFSNKDILEIKPSKKSLLYIDPPYKGTTKYKDKFDYEKFYEWCRDRHKEGHIIFVSEYEMPDDFKCIWSKEINSSLTKDTGSKKGIEKLFIL